MAEATRFPTVAEPYQLVATGSTLGDVAAPATFVMNVGEIRNRGVELAVQKDSALVHGLELSGDVTFVDSTILFNRLRQSERHDLDRQARTLRAASARPWLESIVQTTLGRSRWPGAAVGASIRLWTAPTTRHTYSARSTASSLPMRAPWKIDEC